MPVYKVGNKYKIGKKGKAIYKTKASANKAYLGYLAKKRNK